ncbi:EAL domain-containing protein [Synechococcus elongatus]|uniref:EAL domain-containing protein n=1 Tax=Synechococcus elongatus TaxID=32046 RepID=UPI000F7DE014|nr:EAL domain-containing protein [Synechococcus elongatus]
MKKRNALIFAVGTSVFAIALPTLISINIASREALIGEQNYMLATARGLLRSSEKAADQVDKGFKELRALQSVQTCDPEQIQVMRKIDLASAYIQAIGYVSGNKLVCSSMGKDSLDLGPVDIVQPSGAKLRRNVEFNFAKGLKFIVIERDGFAAVIQKDVPLDISKDVENISITTLSKSNPETLTARGFIDPKWISALNNRQESTFIDKGHIIAAVPSQRYFLGAVVATPVTGLASRTRAIAWIIVPVGILAGIILWLSVIYFLRGQLALPAVIKTAIKRREFFLTYQPIVNLQTGDWVGAEALVRWKRPDGKTMAPDIFIPVAEDSGLIQLITEYIVETLSREAIGFFDEFPRFHIGINLSAADLHTPQTVSLMRKVAKATSAKPGSLIVEATERGFTDPKLANGVISSLRADGIQVAIDDFGTGYSSLSYLENLELDYLKIDKSFVDTIGRDTATSNVVTHIIEIAKTLDLMMVAEGVETELQANFLRDRGVQYAQGWFFAKPMLFSELYSKLRARAMRSYSKA